jgi:hypothetical protein
LSDFHIRDWVGSAGARWNLEMIQFNREAPLHTSLEFEIEMAAGCLKISASKKSPTNLGTLIARNEGSILVNS